MRTGGGRRRSRGLGFVAVLAVLVLTGCNDLFAAGWGNNQYGQLGTGNTVNSSTPVDVNTDTALRDKVVVQVAAGTWDSCATTADGTGACWGALAPIPPNPVWETLPYPVPNSGVLAGKTITKVVPLGTGETRCALTSDGTVGCWRNSQPVPFTPGFEPTGSPVVQLAPECALNAAGVLKCGIGLIGTQVINATGVLAGKTIVQITGRCALTSDSLIACWGFNSAGQRGDGTTNNSTDFNYLFTPTLVVQNGAMAGRTVASIATGSNYNCAVTTDGAGFCWGANTAGKLGTGNTTGSNVPVQVVQAGALAGKGITTLSPGQEHTCAILTDESMACWGKNTSGELGNGTTTDSLVPVAVNPMPNIGGPRPIVTTTAGGGFNLAVYQEQVASQFVPLPPRRVFDTRAGGGAPVGPGGQVAFTIADAVPDGTTAVAYNLTATGQTASGAAALVPSGSTVGAAQTSVINWSGPQQTIANGFLVKVPATRELVIKLNSTGSSHFVVDVTGYFIGPGSSDGTLYNPADERVYDSRDGGGPLAPGQSRVLNVAGGPGVTAGEAGATDQWPTQAMNGLRAAAALNVTVTGTVGSGVMAVAKDASTTTSTVNWTGPAQTVANAVITDVAVDGSFTVTNNGPTPADVVVDLTGTFLPASVSDGASFFPTDPDRSYDSRATNGRLVAGQSRGNTFPVPSDSVAVAVNTTITGTAGTGYLSVTPPPFATIPTTSMVNWFTSPTTRANGAIVPVQGTATRAYTGGNFSTEYLYDTAGYFR